MPRVGAGADKCGPFEGGVQGPGEGGEGSLTGCLCGGTHGTGFMSPIIFTQQPGLTAHRCLIRNYRLGDLDRAICFGGMQARMADCPSFVSTAPNCDASWVMFFLLAGIFVKPQRRDAHVLILASGLNSSR
jgi:hypothetical protein